MSFNKKLIDSSTNEKPNVRKYYPVPPIITNPYEYINVNKDVNLRKNVVTFFHKKVISWLENDTDFNKYKDQKTFIESIDGQIHIYSLLRKFVKRSGINWYDLRDNYSIIKKYLSKKL
jgi:hypothetical protein